MLSLKNMKLITLEEEIYIIESLLSEEKCKELVVAAENMGFAQADVQVSANKRQLISGIRNNERVNYESSVMAESLWDRLKALSLPDYSGKAAIGLSPFFRFYKYLPGHKFNMHKDGRQDVDGHTTYYTLIIYLNNECEGGATKFRRGNVLVQPTIGNALLFQHHLWHQGVKVESGVKYVLRTDVIYER